VERVERYQVPELAEILEKPESSKCLEEFVDRFSARFIYHVNREIGVAQDIPLNERIEQLEKSSQELAVTLDDNNKRFELLFNRTDSRVEALADDTLVGRGFSGEVSRRLAELEVKPQPPRSHWPLLVTLAAACALFAVLAWTLQKSIDRVATAITTSRQR
jgi:hypothetical protein